MSTHQVPDDLSVLEDYVVEVPEPQRRRRPSGRTVTGLLVTTAGLVALTVAQVVVVAPAVEHDLARDARVALQTAGVTTVQVSADGRDLVLSGTVTDLRQASQVEHIADGVAGVRYVDTRNLTVGEGGTKGVKGATGAGSTRTPGPTPSTPATAAPATGGPTTTLVVVADQGRALVAGTLPRTAGRDLTAALRTVFGAGAVDARYVVDDNAPADGVEAVAATVEALGPQADTVAVSLSRGTVTVAASVTSKAVEKAALAAAAPAASGAQVVDEVVVAGPVASPEAVATQLGAVPDLVYGAKQTTPGPVGRSLLAAVAFILDQRSAATVTLVGHTEDTGDPETDSSTSLARARAAETYLGTLGVPGSRVVSRGVGSTDPAVEGTDADAVAANRRLVVSGG